MGEGEEGRRAIAAVGLARGGALGLATVVAERGLGLAVVVVVGRLLTPIAFGRYAFIVAYLNLFQSIADLGVEAIVLRRLAQAAERGRLLANALGLRFALTIVAATGAIALAPWAGADGPGERAVVASAAAALLLTGQPGYRALLRSQMRIGAVFGVALFASGLVLLAVVLAARAGADLAELFLAAAVAQLAGFALAAWVARRQFAFRVALDARLWIDLLRDAWPIGANLLIVTLGMRAAALILMRERGPIEVGYFSSAARLTEALNLIADGAMLTAFPLLARFALERREAMLDLARLVAKGLAIAFLAVVLAVRPLAPEILARLFRPEFAAAAPALVVLSWAALLTGLGTLYGGLLVAIQRQRVLFWLNAATALLQIGLQSALIPRLGLVGAALASLATSAAAHLALALLPATRALVLPCLAAAVGPLACAVAVLLLSPFVPLAPLAQAALLVAGFLLLALATGVVGRADLAKLRALAHGPAWSGSPHRG